MSSEVEERCFVDQIVLEAIVLGRIDFFVGCDSTATVNGAPGVSHLDFAVAGPWRSRAGVIVVVVVERNAGVVALDEAAGWRVVVIRGQRESRVFAQVIDGLNQALAECGL